MLAHRYGFGGQFVAIDNSEAAIECTEMNARIYGFGDTIETRLMDLRDAYLNEALFGQREEAVNFSSEVMLQEVKSYKSLATELGLP